MHSCTWLNLRDYGTSSFEIETHYGAPRILKHNNSAIVMKNVNFANEISYMCEIT